MNRMTPAARRVLIVAGALLIVSWALFATVVLPGDYQAGTSTFGPGLAVTAFVLGMRHAFDADHIAAIDNTSRKLVADGNDPSSVGLWFALGHSTVVLVAVGLVTAGVGALTSQIGAEDSPLAVFTGVWDPQCRASSCSPWRRRTWSSSYDFSVTRAQALRSRTPPRLVAPSR